MPIKWTDQMLFDMAKTFSTRTEFSRQQASAYATSINRGILDKVCAHMEIKRRRPNKSDVLSEAAKYKTLSELIKNAPYAYQAAQKHGWLGDLHKIVKPQSRTWTNQQIEDAAALCKTPKEFERKFSSAYQIAQTRGIYQRITEHMQRRMEEWTIDKLSQEASSFGTRKDFERGASAAYQFARRRGLLDEICGHMEPGLRSNFDAVYLWRAKGECYNGKGIYKIGVTSRRLGMQRIQLSGCRNKMTPEVVFIGETAGYAKDLERVLLSHGENPKLDAADGKTEFRALSDREVEKVLEVMRAACKPQQQLTEAP